MMSEDQTPTQAPAAPKARRHGGGWPKGKPRVAAPSPASVKAAADRAEMRPLISKMKARPNWESDDFVSADFEGVDRLAIPRDKVEALRREGVALEWGTQSVRGAPTPRQMADAERRGWTIVHNGDFDGVLDGLFVPKGSDLPITVDDAILLARPVSTDIKAKQAERRAAMRPLEISETQIGYGIPNVTGASHPTATRGNQIKKTMERVEIPE